MNTFFDTRNMNMKFWTLEFWKDIGYSLNSSQYLSERLVSIANIHKANIILELWAGEWQVTKYIIAKKWPNTRLVSIENHHESYMMLQDTYGKQCETHEISAAHLDKILEPNSVDIIISTLPLWSISPEWVDAILKSAHRCLKSNWIFIQYQYWMYNRKDIKQYFTIDTTYWEPRNIWPAFIYKAHKK